MVSPPNSERLTSEHIHRRETVRYILLPAVGVGALVVLGLVIMALLPGRLQVSLIADWMVTILFLCPLVLCLFPVCILMIAAVVGMNKLHQGAATPLRKLENLSASIRDRAVKATDTINHQTVNASAKWAFIDRWLSVFDPPATTDDPPKEG